jgi:hypothetical protein
VATAARIFSRELRALLGLAMKLTQIEELGPSVNVGRFSTLRGICDFEDPSCNFVTDSDWS